MSSTERASGRKPENHDMGGALMLSAHTCGDLLDKLAKRDYSDSGGCCRLIVFNPDEERVERAISILKKGKPNRGAYDIWFSYTSMLSNGGKIAYVFPGFWDEAVTETDSLSEALGLPCMDHLIAQMKETDANGLYYQRRYNTKLLCMAGLEKLGVEPAMYLGYSLGEWEAALFAGIIKCDVNEWTDNFAGGWDSFEHFYPLVLVRGASRQLIGALCDKIPDLYLSIDNCPSQVILTGKEPAVAALIKILEEKGAAHVLIPNRTALHTPLVANTLSDKFKIFREAEIREGRVPVWSSTTLEKAPTEKEAYLEYLTVEKTKTVRFREAVEKLYAQQQARIFIQIGPGPLPDYVVDTLEGKDFGAISASVAARGGADQLRRVMALLYIEGWRADAGFIGVRPQNRFKPDAEPNQSPRLPPGSADLIAAAVYNNIQSVMSLEQNMRSLRQNMLSIQFEMAKLFKLNRKGVKFEETLRLAFEDHPYLIGHSIVRQPKGWPIWEDMNPVVPFTMIIELFAEIAMKRAPGEKLIKVGNITAFKWIELETPLEVIIRGEWRSQEALRLSMDGYASAECVFAESFPKPEAKFEGSVDIGKEILKPGEPEQWYDEFTFHGPQYRSVVSYEKICERGVAGVTESKEGKGSLLDAAGQMLGLFVRATQTRDTIVFPIRLEELNLYADIRDQEGVFENTVIVTGLTGSSAMADAVVKRGGAVWCVMRSFVLQRFVSAPSLWRVILDPRFEKLATGIARGVNCYECKLQDNVLSLLIKRYLSKPEREYYRSLKSPKQKRENLISRIALKDAVRSWLAGCDGEMMYPIEFYCVHDENGKPSLVGYGRAAGKVEGLHISLAHKGNAAAAIVSDRPAGIDLEMIGDKSAEFINTAFTEGERRLLAVCGQSEAVIRFWAAKEAYSKMRGEGLMDGAKRCEISGFDGDTLIIGDVAVQTSKLGNEYIVGWASPAQ